MFVWNSIMTSLLSWIHEYVEADGAPETLGPVVRIVKRTIFVCKPDIRLAQAEFFQALIVPRESFMATRVGQDLTLYVWLGAADVDDVGRIYSKVLAQLEGARFEDHVAQICAFRALKPDAALEVLDSWLHTNDYKFIRARLQLRSANQRLHNNHE
jgi:hypothetical protein